MLFEVVTIDLHYMTDRHERFDLKISKLKILWKQRHLLYISDGFQVSYNIPKIYFKVNYHFNFKMGYRYSLAQDTAKTA